MTTGMTSFSICLFSNNENWQTRDKSFIKHPLSEEREISSINRPERPVKSIEK